MIVVKTRKTGGAGTGMNGMKVARGVIRMDRGE
jgi:hypothetical protein